MDARYQDLHRQAVQLHNKFQDIVDDRTHPIAHVLQREAKELIEDIESNKQPRAVEERIKTIQHQLTQARFQGENVMSYQDVDYLHHAYERQRDEVRRMPHY